MVVGVRVMRWGYQDPLRMSLIEKLLQLLLKQRSILKSTIGVVKQVWGPCTQAAECLAHFSLTCLRCSGGQFAATIPIGDQHHIHLFARSAEFGNEPAATNDFIIGMGGQNQHTVHHFNI